MSKIINIKGSLLDLSSPVVMGIVNVTPDSFYTNSRVESDTQIIERVGLMLEQGATIIDIGAQSTNPNSPLLSVTEEVSRLTSFLPELRRLFPKAILSIDTFYADVAKMAVEDCGVDIVNDISGGQMDAAMFRTVAELKVPYVLMHMKGTPQNMVHQVDYANLQQDIFYYFSEKIETLRLMGVNDIILDPGFGFSKTLHQNYEVMAQLSNFHIFELPLLVGISRKSMIYRLLGVNADGSLNGTTALNMYSLCNGAAILRVHDVKEAVETVRIFNEIKGSEF
ncbi:MAG: dihydropteroate synthase [Dysgonamonadaceae bacterium]